MTMTGPLQRSNCTGEAWKPPPRPDWPVTRPTIISKSLGSPGSLPLNAILFSFTQSSNPPSAANLSNYPWASYHHLPPFLTTIHFNLPWYKQNNIMFNLYLREWTKKKLCHSWIILKELSCFSNTRRRNYRYLCTNVYSKSKMLMFKNRYVERLNLKTNLYFDVSHLWVRHTHPNTK